MAAIPVTITGVMVYSGLEVGGGPMPPAPGIPAHPIYIPPVSAAPPIYYPPVFPAHPIAPGGPPPGIWGGAPIPMPTPPIYYPPVFPAHPIVTPPPSEGSGLPEGGWAWSPFYGWVWQPAGSGGKPKPPSQPEEPAV